MDGKFRPSTFSSAASILAFTNRATGSIVLAVMNGDAAVEEISLTKPSASVAERSTDRRCPSGSRMTINWRPREEVCFSRGKLCPKKCLSYILKN